ncbi:MAG TPA: twin-arginine translocase subunit TatB [Aurantimonas coralicida]|uniref:Sec-independent protein translocase protein TatB n=2 Tax=root TaxID=1 RepID=A0A9C9NDP5_9HYPH|nr:twin-arginine translocase subunit TatB [Aurantimonas coralicida]HET99292.1 twin-arginine translocase subunit TatB [Aurantimonas coralicida]
MFDIGWAELMMVAVVLVVVVGPRDLPKMLRTFGRTTKQLRSMAGDFRRQFDDALREAELDDVRSTVSDIRKLDPTKDVRAAMNPMKAVGDEIRSSLKAAASAPEPKVPSPTAPAIAEKPDKAGATAKTEGSSATPASDAKPAATSGDAKVAPVKRATKAKPAAKAQPAAKAKIPAKPKPTAKKTTEDVA